jgi:hypothetical protein
MAVRLAAMLTTLAAALPSDPSFYAVGLAATFLIAFGKGAFGGGLALLGIPLLALVIDPLDAAIIVAVLVALMDMFALKAFGRANMSMPDLAVLLPGLAAGVAVGWLVFTLVDARIVTLAIGLITLAFAAQWFLKGRSAPESAMAVNRPLGLAAGALAGFTTFVAHSGGPPLAMYLLRRGLTKSVFAGTTVAVFTLGNLLKLPPYLWLGFKEPATLVMALALTPAVPLGVWAGAAMHERLAQRTLFFWCYVLLTAAAAKLTFDAARALLA